MIVSGRAFALFVSGLILFSCLLVGVITVIRIYKLFKYGKPDNRTDAQQRDWVFGLMITCLMLLAAAIGVVKYHVDWF